jgi:N6-adenosine-specific RNA methylase IME4
MGRRPIGRRAMTDAQRAKRARVKRKRAATGAKKRAKREARLEIMRGRTVREMQRLGTMQPIYNVIYADTPPKFEVYSNQTGMDRAADNHYLTMLESELLAMAPSIPAVKGACRLYIWATPANIEVMLLVMKAWGFTYASQIVWVKGTLDGTKVKHGTGYEVWGAHEILLIGDNGPLVPSPARGTQPISVVFAPATKHSVKPAIFAEMIEKLFPDLRKLEMFARTHRDSWDVWGNEAPI